MSGGAVSLDASNLQKQSQDAHVPCRGAARTHVDVYRSKIDPLDVQITIEVFTCADIQKT